MQRWSTILAYAVISVLTACADPNIAPVPVPFAGAQVIATGPTLRLITDRPRVVDGQILPILCSEPNPDVAVAFGRSLAAQASIQPSSGLTDSGSLNVTSTEVATALSGRTAGVLALRDGLYAACQSYVNGVIGHDAYALILSQYGNLLVALASEKPPTSTAFSARDNAVTALLVSCISQYDPTRLAQPGGNPLLSQRVCNALVSRIANGGLGTTPRAHAKSGG